MMDYEKLGQFYLGRHRDPESGEATDQPLLYDAKDLVTHAVCVGMTGSGKTGLGIGLLEEAAIDGVPALVIDPKGDLGNLLLTFPELRPQDFLPWVNPDDARRKGRTPEEHAADQARLWRDGLAAWEQDGERIRRLRESAEFAIYTPGSDAGLPVSILASFEAPDAAVLEDGDLLRERIASTATSLLGLLGIEADPIQSREHILLANLFERLWTSGESVDLAGLVRAIQEPPMARVGVLDLESFFPSKERFKLAMQVNNLLAAPGFGAWLTGAPLDVGKLLHTDSGKPRVAIFSIAHLSEAERMFFVSLLLNQTLAWMRSRPGTTSLRALLYIDEIFGYMPPVAEPPSKRPLLTLLKQARAYGLGVVLATQNPVDLDYKGLSNAGTWFLGRLQTERDKARVLEGLASVAGGGADRGDLGRRLSGLGKRVFLLHNVHEEGTAVFETRWVMSYLAGPLTRQQIRRLTGDAPSRPSPEAAPAPRAEAGGDAERPVIAPEVKQYFLPMSSPAPLYAPGVLGLARVQYVDSRTKREIHRQEPTLWAQLADDGADPDWAEAEELPILERDLLDEPPGGARFAPLPPGGGQPRNYATWQKALADHLYRSSSCELLHSKALKLTSEPGESERDFRVRLTERAREERDEAISKLRRKHAERVERLEDRIRRARQALEREQEQARGAKLSNAVSVAATLLSAFTGRRKLSYTTVSRAGTAIRGLGRSSQQSGDVERAEETIEALTAELEDLNVELTREIEELDERYDALAEELEVTALRPRRADVEVRQVALGWRSE